MSKVQQANDYLQLKQQTDRDVRQLGVLAGEKYEADSTANQTVINLNFSVTQTTEQKRGFQLYIDGQLLREGAANDFTFTAISGGVSSQVTLNASIAAGLNIVAYKIGGYSDPFPSPSSVQATLLNDVAQPHKMAQAAFQPFVQKQTTPALVTTITNRAQIDIGLKPFIGNERVPLRSIALVTSEIGSLGEPVYELSSSKDSRIRFVGSGWVPSSALHGAQITTASLTDYMEIVFYGTGLNLLMGAVAASADFRASIDGAAEGSNLVPTNMSTIINSRSYAPNVGIPIVSGLTPGVHTVKIRTNSANMNFNVQGVEFINNRTTLGILPGIAFSGMKQDILSALSASAFDAGVVGTRGARVVKYIKDNVISQAVQEVNSASAFLTSTDHTNEEAVRKINFREFGVNRSDDFSTIPTSTSSRIFTLDDGTTSLVGYNVREGQVAATSFSAQGAIGNFFTLTFVGTGLDVVIATDSVSRSADIYVDNTLVGTATKTGNSFYGEVRKICSGLPYGTHTVRFYCAAAVDTFAVSDFIIYQPKKPSIPTGATEIADYNVVATYVANSSTSVNALATGVVRKMNVREFLYSGSSAWAYQTIDATLYPSGVDALQTSSAIGNRVTFSFFGTGFDWRQLANGNTGLVQFAINGTNLTSANFPTASISSYGFTNAYPTSTGIQDQVGSGNVTAGVKCSGLPLGYYTLTVTTTNSSQMRVSAIDVITPIHINLPVIKTGSTSIRDSRAFSPIVDKPNVVDLSKAKAWILYDMANNAILARYNITAILVVSTGNTRVYFEKPFKDKNYVVTGGVFNTGRIASFSDKHASFINVISTTENASAENNVVAVTFFGELEDEGEI